MTYTYECLELECGEQFDIDKGINEDIEIKCPICGNKEVKRIYKAITSIAKCDGFFGKSK